MIWLAYMQWTWTLFTFQHFQFDSTCFSVIQDILFIMMTPLPFHVSFSFFFISVVIFSHSSLPFHCSCLNGGWILFVCEFPCLNVDHPNLSWNRLGQGRDKTLQYLKENTHLLEEVEKVGWSDPAICYRLLFYKTLISF